MKTYSETCQQVRVAIKNKNFSFPNYDKLDYTGIGFGYNLQKKYPKTMKEAEKDILTPNFDALVKSL